ncbi:putative Cysteine/Histidine-rich C1 domain family protein [Melia azedarach]|uniref:Cysteine/Histidine-rich C1 domain family protein n=1 Tax=Melia azedarach TaxID=155640 RepID=A0ACC1XP97_MELAZ|nr:putative Cysteine/Histidine-rich C1 domain family protein [Melia azedarach]
MKPKVKYEGHDYPLILVENIYDKSDCQECGFKIEGTFFVRCVPCRLNFHIKCGPFPLPPTTNEPKHHPHPLILNNETKLVKDDSEADSGHPLHCGACEKEINHELPFYSCADCDYSAHVSCVITEIQLERREKLRHFSHKHTLYLRDHKEENGETFCQACLQKDHINSTVYGCDPCQFYLHKSCSELPKEMHHPFHQHSLILQNTPKGNGISCHACHCAALRPSIKFGGHKHLLTFINKLYDIQKSTANTEISSRGPSCFRCVRCNFDLEIESIIPKAITHGSHAHTLRLKDGFDGFVEHEHNEYRCDVCRTKIDTRGCVYCCAECGFVLDFQCVISEVLLSLTTRTFSEAGDEGRQAVEGERMENYFLHEHLLTLCEISDGEIVCHGCGSPFSGESYTCSNCGFYPDRCIACNETPSDSFYICKLCWPKSPLFHKSCVELPQEIQISYHPHNSLHLTEGFEELSYDLELCHFCDKKGGFSERCKFCCNKCNFQIHFECAAKLIKYHEGREQVKHFSHRHNLALLELGIVDCRICNKKIHGPCYGCVPCEFYMHNSCFDLPQEIQHSFHQLHCLTLQTSSLTKWRDACGQKIKSSMCYTCNNCNFDLHLECASLKPNIKYEGHEHLLILVENMSNQGECEACGVEIQGTFYVRCVGCNINFHVQCGPVSLPPTVMDKHHKHPLSLSTKTVLVDDDSGCDPQVCDACSKERNPEHPFYCCTLCDYSAHASCVVTEVQLIEREKLRHFSHQHFLFPLKDKIKNDDVLCYACEKLIEGAVYGCEPCELYLHESCGKLPREIEHPFHKHSLVLPEPYSRKERECSACYKHCFGFTYRCNDCDFDLDLDCASLQPSIEYIGHGHILTFFEKLYGIPKCIACSFTSSDVSYLRCVICNFNIHLWCSPLPETIRHKSHQDHHLCLMDSFVDDNYDSQICDVCEEHRDARECVYYCAECNFISEFNCATFEVINCLKGWRGDVSLRTIKYRENRDKVVRKGLTWSKLFEILAEKKRDELQDLLREFREFLLKMKEGCTEDNVAILEIVPHSDEAFGPFIAWLGSTPVTDSDDMNDILNREHKVVCVGDYMISQKLAPVLKKLLAKYGDITNNCAFTERAIKTFLLSLICTVVRSMCKTIILDVNDNLICKWWLYLKMAQLGGFQIDFVFSHLQKIVHARNYETSIEINRKSAVYRTLKELKKVEQKISQLSQKIDKQREKLKNLRNKRERIIDSRDYETSVSDDVLEYVMKNAGTGLL